MLEEEEADPCPLKEKDGSAAETSTPRLRRKPPPPRVCNLSFAEQAPKNVGKHRCGGSNTHEQSPRELNETQKPRNASRKRHVCNICKKSFSHKSSLDIHCCTHAPSRPFASSMCQNSSSVRGVPFPKRLSREEAGERQAETSLEAEVDRLETSLSRLRRRPLSRTLCSLSCKEGITEKVHKHEISGDKTRKHGHKKLPGRQKCANASRKRHVCSVCEKTFSKKYNLDIHIRIHTGERPFKCNVCEQSFLQKCHLESHIRVHTDERPFKCNICKKSFLHKSNLNSHTRIHTGEKPFKYNVCKKTFSYKSHLNRHILIHTGEKPFKCNVCERPFLQKVNLDSHILIHTGERPFKCNVCEKSFLQKCTLDRHNRTHTGEKPFKCNVCEKTFSHKCNLEKHILIHTGEKPFKCNVCKKSFCQKCHLDSHVRIHTGERPFKCKLCEKFFSHKRSLRTHLHSHMRKSL